MWFLFLSIFYFYTESYVENLRDIAKPILEVTPDKNLKNGDILWAKWTDIPNPEKTDHIGMLCDKDLTSNKIERFFKIYTSSKSVKPTGKLQIKAYFHRADCIFYYLKMLDKNQYKIIVKSNTISFAYHINQPQHIRLSVTSNPTEMAISWITGEDIACTLYYWWSGSKKMKLKSTSKTYTNTDMCELPATGPNFIDPGFIQNVTLKNLPYDTEIKYYIENKDAKSDIISFKSRPENLPVSFIIFGDLGTDKSTAAYKTVDRIYEMQTQPYPPNVIFHVGDISYARGKSYIWDIFGIMIEKISKSIPYMVAIGNHEHIYKNGQKNDPSGEIKNKYAIEGMERGSGGECSVPMINRFFGPENGNKLFWYSFDYVSVHTIVLCSELDISEGSRQYKWFLNDLKNIDRNKIKWIVVMLHRPIYSSFGSEFYISKAIRKSLEPLLLEYKVDLVYTGHTHLYERTCKISKSECMENSKNWGITYITVGSSGMLDKPPNKKLQTFSKKLVVEYGFGKLIFLDDKNARWILYSTLDGSILDQLEIKK